MKRQKEIKGLYPYPNIRTLSIYLLFFFSIFGVDALIDLYNQETQIEAGDLSESVRVSFENLNCWQQAEAQKSADLDITPSNSIFLMDKAEVLANQAMEFVNSGYPDKALIAFQTALKLHIQTSDIDTEKAQNLCANIIKLVLAKTQDDMGIKGFWHHFWISVSTLSLYLILFTLIVYWSEYLERNRDRHE